jgi:hypothetical protein
LLSKILFPIIGNFFGRSVSLNGRQGPKWRTFPNHWNPAFAESFGGQADETGFQKFFQTLEKRASEKNPGNDPDCALRHYAFRSARL